MLLSSSMKSSPAEPAGYAARMECFEDVHPGIDGLPIPNGRYLKGSI